jgi:exodeoxyribonuclease VII small subunit
MSDLTNANLEGLSYEEALSELERVVTALETEEHPLEAALALYERGQALARYCAGLLDKAELKVQQLSSEELEEFQP